MPPVITLAALTAAELTAASMFPGQREATALTRFAVPARRASVSNSTMDASTVLERQREGGGGPAERLTKKS